MIWKLEEARLVQERANTSAADADSLAIGVNVPLGKCWIILACRYTPSVAETRDISFYRITRTGVSFPILNPIALALNPSSATFLEQGMEYLLFQGESLSVRRSAHTAGSTMDMNVEFVEIDMPLYTYDEPLIVKRQQRVLSSIRSRLGGGTGVRGGGGPSPGVPPGGGGGGAPMV